MDLGTRGRPLPRAEHVVASSAGRWDTGRMAIARSESERTALLEIVTLIARDAPQEILFATVSEHAARRIGTEAGSVLHYIGDERAVVVGVWREGGKRRLPVNAELDFDVRNSAIGRVRRTGRPARADSYDGHTGELPVVMRAIDVRASVAAPVMLGDEVWGTVVASTTTDQPLPAESEHQLDDFAELIGLAVANAAMRDAGAKSRKSILETGYEARRRLERDLHEGVQQHLLALTLKLRVAQGRAEPGSEVAGLLEDALEEAAVANTSLRDLARSLYPKVLTERGLAVALQGLAARAAVPVTLLELPRRRFDALAEGTAYFTVADMLAATVATEAAVIVGDRGDRLVVEVRGDREAEPPPGIAERVAAVGGRLVVDGPSVRAELPVER
jgi:GAF domain-containing protein